MNVINPIVHQLFTDKFHNAISQLILSYKIKFPKELKKSYLLSAKGILFIILSFIRVLFISIMVSICVSSLICLIADKTTAYPPITVLIVSFIICMILMLSYFATHYSLFLNKLCLKLIKPTIAFNLTQNIIYDDDGCFTRLEFKDADHFYPTYNQRFTVEDNKFQGKTTVMTSEVFQRVFNIFGIRGLMNAVNTYEKFEVSEYDKEDRS